MSGSTGSQSLSEIYGFPVPDTWANGQNITADDLNRNVRDSQLFIANAPLTIVCRTAVQSLATGSNTLVSFDTQVVDVDNMFTAPSTSITVKRPGIYAIEANVSFAASTLGNVRVVRIQVNGVTLVNHNDAPASVSPTLLAASTIVALNVGDVIAMQVFQDSGSAINVGGTALAPRLSARLISTAAITLTYTPSAPPTSTGAKPPPSKPPTAPTPTRHVSSFAATWSRSYLSTGATRYDDPAYCYQGAYPGYGGNQRSLVGFNQASIQSTLAGATNITGTLSFRPQHAYYNSGLTVIIGTHNYSAKPGSWNTNNVYESQLSKSSCVANNNYSVNLSSWQCWAFQNGTVTGIAFGPAPNLSLTYYGFMYGAGQGGRPSLTFTYYK